MKPSERMYNGQIEITDLIAEAVSNAEARRHQVIDSEDTLSVLSNEEARSVTGAALKPIQPWIIVGIIAYPGDPIA